MNTGIMDNKKQIKASKMAIFAGALGHWVTFRVKTYSRFSICMLLGDVQIYTISEDCKSKRISLN